MKIDLIIPYYNNPEGLARTLDSINRKVFYVTVVDDSSDIHMYPNPKADQVIRSNMNRGPGFARQLGLEKTHYWHVMFMDTGDTFLSDEVQYCMQFEVNASDFRVYSQLYYHYDKLSTHEDNRLHGKIYARSFLNKYGITFPLETSYLDEDIGFNRTCNIILQANNLQKRCIDVPVIQQYKDENSLTQKDNQVTLFRDQTRALSLATIHTIETCRRNNIEAKEEINQIAITLYYWFIRTAAERPEFIKESWAGARIFYNKFKNEINPNNLLFGNAKLKQCLQYRNKIAFPINILRFADEIQKNEIPPNNYLT